MPLKQIAIGMLIVFWLAALPARADEPEQTDLAPLIERLMATPVLYNMDSDILQAIFETGQQSGNHPDVFAKVGDSNTTSGDFLIRIGLGEAYCDLGDYAYLQATIDYFSAVSPREGERNSFTSYSLAAINGLSSAAALDPFWASTDECQPNESPLTCEYRAIQPAVSIIMLGMMDARYWDAATFRPNMELIVEESIRQGVIPVLTTFVVLPDQEALSYEESIRMNVAMVEIADEYGIPLINLWAAAQDLPGYGIGPDRTHLSHAVDAFCDFTGAEQAYGGTLRNLLTVQALHQLRLNVLQDNR